MEHKVGDRVRIKLLKRLPEFSGLIAKITDLGPNQPYIVIPIDKKDVWENEIHLFENEFINLDHLEPEVKLTRVPVFEPEQKFITFAIPDNLLHGTFEGEEQGLKYTLHIGKISDG